jgi:hypothetical protein
MVVHSCPVGQCGVYGVVVGLDDAAVPHLPEQQNAATPPSTQRLRCAAVAPRCTSHGSRSGGLIVTTSRAPGIKKQNSSDGSNAVTVLDCSSFPVFQTDTTTAVLKLLPVTSKTAQAYGKL